MPKWKKRVEMSRLILVAASVAAAWAGISAARAAEFSLDGQTLTMTGPIEHGDVLKLQAAIRGGPSPAVLRLDSQGGYISDAVAIADYVRQLHTITEVRDTCWSACILVFAAGMQRWAGPDARFGVHQAGSEGVESVRATGALEIAYGRFQIPRQITAKMLATPFTSMSFLTPADLAAWQVKPKV